MAEQLDLLAAIASDHVHAEDRAKVEAAILAVAAEHDGRVDPNLVRQQLTNRHGLTVYPRLLSACYSALASHKRTTWALEWRGETTKNLDRAGGNYGKPLRVWRVVQRGEVAA